MNPEIEKVLNGESDGCIVCGDCLEVMADMPDGCVDAVVTDPPYGVAFHGKTTKYTRGEEGYAGEDSDVGIIAAPVALRLCDRAVIFSGLRLMFAYPAPYDIGLSLIHI